MLIGVEGCASRFEAESAAERQHIFGIKLDCFRFMGVMTMPRSVWRLDTTVVVGDSSASSVIYLFPSIPVHLSYLPIRYCENNQCKEISRKGWKSREKGTNIRRQLFSAVCPAWFITQASLLKFVPLRSQD